MKALPRLFTTIIATALCLVSAQAEAAAVAPIDREVSERFFLTAYDHFLENRLWDSLDCLAEAQRNNTYFVDIYYMRSLVFRRLGRYPDAIAAMKSYLEVRRDDHRGAMIQSCMEEEWKLLREMLNPAGIPNHFVFRAQRANSYFGLPMSHPLVFSGMTGLGKISSFEGLIFTPDTLGNNLWIFVPNSRGRLLQMPVAFPVAVLPLAGDSFLLLQKNGDLLRVMIRGMDRGDTSVSELASEDASALSLAPSRIGSVKADAADGALINSSLLAVADRLGSAVKLVALPTLENIAVWRPKQARKLFEPVALASFGPLLAVADRGNGAVFVLDGYTLAERERFEVASPRDLEWGRQGELYVLNERGELFVIPAAGEKKPLRLVSRMNESWSITWTERGPVVADVSGRNWWTSNIYPAESSSSVGALNLRSPVVTGERKAEKIVLRGPATSLYPDVLRETPPSSRAVWRDEVRPSLIKEEASQTQGEVLIYSQASDGEQDVRFRHGTTFEAIWADLAAASRAGERAPAVIVLDADIELSPHQQLLFLSYLLHQGTRLDIWALRRPASAALTSLSRVTSGRTYFADKLGPIWKGRGRDWVVTVPLPPETVSFGYPTDATLSIIVTSDVIRFNDWLPIWPSLIRRINERE